MVNGSDRAVQGSDPDAPLVARARAGDAEAAEALIARHLDGVYRLIRGILRDPDAAEDAAQEAWLLALRGLPEFRGDASFRTWVLRIALNTAYTAQRRSGRRREDPLPEREALAAADDPEGRAVARSEVERVEGALARLPEKQRMAVSLRVHEGLSYREIGAIIDCSEASARVNYHHGIKRLRELLS
ncbi:MAG: RNA polymerase sigma factor [Longimicrobiales bacterium]